MDDSTIVDVNKNNNNMIKRVGNNLVMISTTKLNPNQSGNRGCCDVERGNIVSGHYQINTYIRSF